MDEEMRAFLDAMMRRLNDLEKRVLDRLGALSNQISGMRGDFDNARGFLLEDALSIGRRMTAVERRLDKL